MPTWRPPAINPLQHYEQFGWKEGRDPSASFDTLGYLAANPDVAAAHVNPLDHFLQFGIYEGRANRERRGVSLRGETFNSTGVQHGRAKVPGGHADHQLAFSITLAAVLRHAGAQSVRRVRSPATCSCCGC